MITLQFVCTDSILSKLIAWYGNGWHGFSHVDAVLPDGSLLGARSTSVGGKPPGVQIRPANYEKWIRVSRISFNPSQSQADTWVNWLVSQVGKQYDMSNILDFIIGDKTHQDGRWICSALQMAALLQVKLLSPAGVPAQQITPDTLHAICCASGWVVQS